MHVDHHHNKLEQIKKSLYFVTLSGKISNSFLFAILRGYMVVTFNLKAFHSSCETKTFGAILLRGLPYNENNDWALTARLKFLRWPREKRRYYLI